MMISEEFSKGGPENADSKGHRFTYFAKLRLVLLGRRSAWFGVIFSLRGAFVSCGDKKTM
jgi:hypothetical protein